MSEISPAIAHPALDIRLAPDFAEQALRADVAAGLTATPKSLPPKWFYDARGSELFEQITALPEYYPTRTERVLIAEHADEIAALTDTSTLVELGSGSSEKTRLLIDAMVEHETLRTYVPQDVSISALGEAITALRADYPRVTVRGIVSDFGEALAPLPGEPKHTLAFLGGTIGNLEPIARQHFLSRVADALADGEHFILGAGLITDVAAMELAYDDAAGVTAEFNRNVLAVLNSRLGANFELANFSHVAQWNSDDEWIEMRLRARHGALVDIPGAAITVEVAAGEEILTEISAKFDADRLAAELELARLPVEKIWTDSGRRFAIFLCRKR